MSQGYVLLLNPFDLPSEAPRLLRDVSGIRTRDAYYRTLPDRCPEAEAIEAGREILSRNPEAAGVVHSSGYNHHLDLGLAVAFSKRAGGEGPHILFSDAHTDDYSKPFDSRRRDGWDLVEYSSFVPALFRETGASGITFAGARKVGGNLTRNLAQYGKAHYYLSPEDISEGAIPALQGGSGIISLNDLDVLSREDMQSSWQEWSQVTARNFSEFLGKSVEGKDLLGFSVLGYDKRPRREGGGGFVNEAYLDPSANMRSAYSYAAAISALCGNPEGARKLCDLSDRTFPVKRRDGNGAFRMFGL